ncbi:MAG TPA: NAD-glutamate dehydrogenase domain-containing protein, partial [Stellaceae bacterium]|nr:NAD-glutamate dehydrogenase domain-containing protein [Stellaceae bacterium]
EVNIKILLDQAIASGALDAAEREPLLAAMAGDVAALVLRDNYLQGQALSIAEARGAVWLDRQQRMIRDLERSGRLDRALDFLPDDEAFAARSAQGLGLVRPELAVLLAHAKMALYEELLASTLPDLPKLIGELREYFPPAVRDRLGSQIAAHPLRREIIATVVTNDLVNRAGVTFIHDMRARTDRTAPEIAQAYLIVRHVFELPQLWDEIELLDNKVAAQLQTEMLLEIGELIERAAAWLLFHKRLELSREIAKFHPSTRSLAGSLGELLPARDRSLVDLRARRLMEAGVPQTLAVRVGGMMFLSAALEIANLVEHTGQPLDRAAKVYYGVGGQFALDEMRAAAGRLRADTPWQKQAVEATSEDLFSLQADLSERILASSCMAQPDPLAVWCAAHKAALGAIEPLTRELRAASTADLAMLVVATRQLRHALG